MSMTAFVLLVFGVSGLVILVWWVMLKALTSKKPGHNGPVQTAAVSRVRAGYEPTSSAHADQHRDHWHDDMLNVTAAQAEWEDTEVLGPEAAEELRRNALAGTEQGMSAGFEASHDSPSPSYDSGSESSWSSDSSSGSDSSSSSGD